MNSNPIGIFDSGLGGLSVLKEVQALLPQEALVYVADSAFAPYGEKNERLIVQRCIHIANILVQQHHIKSLVVACNTATAAAIHILRENLDIPVIGMEPAIKPAVGMTESGVIGVLATENTLKSDKFSNLLDKHRHRARIIIQPCVGLVEAIEQGDLDTVKTQQLLARYVQPLLDAGADTIVLGCTHYPWLEPSIRKLAGEDVLIMSTGAAVAKQLQNQIKANINPHQALSRFYTSGDVAQVSNQASVLFQRNLVFHSLPKKHETVIIEFELKTKQHLLFQALLQGEDGLAFVRCAHGVQQLWTTSEQVEALYVWLKFLPKHLSVHVVREYIWVGK